MLVITSTQQHAQRSGQTRWRTTYTHTHAHVQLRQHALKEPHIKHMAIQGTQLSQV